jgi:Arc/MetJ family transcription regulator
MNANIEIDDDLLKEAMKVTKIKSKKKLVNYALGEYIKTMETLPSCGKIEKEE